MNTISEQQTSPRRSADLSPFELKIEEHDEAEPARKSASHGLLNGEALRSAEGDSAYGCVEWYLYPHRRAPESDERPA